MFHTQARPLSEKPHTQHNRRAALLGRVSLKSRFIASPTTRGKHIIVMSLAWGLNGSVFQCSERASARSPAPGQVHLQLNCIVKVKCSTRCYFSGITSVAQSTVPSLAPTAILLTLDPIGCGEQWNSCRQRLLARLFLKGIFTWVFIYLFFLVEICFDSVLVPNICNRH